MSVIRRKHTANFTTIGNDIFKDLRLEADEVGILVYLLSQPPDWEVRRPALARRFRLGRHSIKRIVLNLIRYGWIVAQKTRLENGTYFTVYEVRDEPGPTLTEEQAKAATSLVSSDADDGDASGEERTEEARPPDDPGPETDPPEPVDQVPVIQGSQTGSGYKKESQKTDSVKTESPKGVRAFSEVKGLWPADKIVSSFKAETIFTVFTDALKEAAFNGVKPYLSDCHSQNRKVCDLSTYLSERRWERFSAKAQAPKWVTIKPYTAQWFRWKEYRLATGKPIAFMEARAKEGAIWNEPSEWPPAMPAKEAIPIDPPPKESENAA